MINREDAAAMTPQRRNALVTGLVLAAMALGIYAVVVLKYVTGS